MPAAPTGYGGRYVFCADGELEGGHEAVATIVSDMLCKDRIIGAVLFVPESLAKKERQASMLNCPFQPVNLNRVASNLPSPSLGVTFLLL